MNIVADKRRPPNMRYAVVFCALVCHVYAPGYAQTVGSIPGAEQDRTLKPMREDENWLFLRDPSLRQDSWDRWKYIKLRTADDRWYMTLGGDIREEWQQIGNDNWGQRSIMNAYFLQRYMFHVDTRYGRYFRTFVRLKSSTESFRAGGPRLTDEKHLDFLAAFGELDIPREETSIRVRMGRQEMSFGSGRLVGLREGSNVRLSYDGVRMTSKFGKWTVDGFAVRPTLDKPGFFDNRPDSKTSFWGVYSSRHGKSVSVDAYYLGINRKRSTYQRGSGREVRQSVGTRLWRPTQTRNPGWDFDYEAIWQSGSFGNYGIRAWTVASDTGYAFPGARFKPRFSVKSDISSGDNPRAHSLGTFNALFPIGNYFGNISSGPGPVNFIDLDPRVQIRMARGVSLTANWVLQWRQSLRDGVYSFPGVLIRAAGTSDARFVGHRPGAELRWQIDRHTWLRADYGVFFAGAFIKQTMPGRNLNFLSLMFGYSF